jgi:quinol monooxygenase YgiN
VVGMAITFINRFTVNGKPEDFEIAFTETAEFIRKQPGLVRYTLSRDLEDETRYVNVALWESAQALRDAVAHPDFKQHAAAMRALATSEGTVYAERLTFAGE